MTGVIVTVQLRLKPEAVEAFCRDMPRKIDVTATRPGFLGIRVVRHQDEPTSFMLIENWASVAAFYDYVAWRNSRGEMGGLQAALDGEMSVEVWSGLIASAGG
ncbi:antibiotic biosynthesis monooxygenase [Sphingopyxis granuli]|uniref:antibiotic biosynthesis monooxygenase family protein n=1 Tax=Sphingopyxis granuli TaxID=267128 RepID=UPI001F537D67|nr:antibiotic biosynthesis monooxygenase family protein [Sphingopyxis granuli]UNK81072.1 antibiotic biosynthesis monooxygenase [Sphingopyxis granuli]